MEDFSSLLQTSSTSSQIQNRNNSTYKQDYLDQSCKRETPLVSILPEFENTEVSHKLQPSFLLGFGVAIKFLLEMPFTSKFCHYSVAIAKHVGYEVLEDSVGAPIGLFPVRGLSILISARSLANFDSSICSGTNHKWRICSGWSDNATRHALNSQPPSIYKHFASFNNLMSLAKPSPSLLQTPLFQSVAYLFLFIFAALIIVCLSYFALSYMADTSSEYEDLMAVQEDKEATTWTFSIIAAVSVVGVIIGGVMVYGGGGSNDATAPTPPRPSPPPEFTFEDGKAYSGDELIKLYENLPRNAIINCDLEVEDKFEECTVLRNPIIDFEGKGAEDALSDAFGTVNIDMTRIISRCCTDKTSKTVIFTTLIKDSNYFPLTTMKDCLIRDCKDHISAKIARNQLYRKFADSNFSGCRRTAMETGKSVKVSHYYLDRIGPPIVNEGIYLECPNGFNQAVNSLQNTAMLYQFALTSVQEKMALVEHNNMLHLHFSTSNNTIAERLAMSSLKSVLDRWDKIKNKH